MRDKNPFALAASLRLDNEHHGRVLVALFLGQFFCVNFFITFAVLALVVL